MYQSRNMESDENERLVERASCESGLDFESKDTIGISSHKCYACLCAS